MRSGGHGAWKDLFLFSFILKWFISFIDVLVLEDRCEHRLCICAIFSFPFIETLWYRVGFRLVMFSGYKSSEEPILRNSLIHSY